MTVIPSRVDDSLTAFDAWQLLERLAKENGVELYGLIRYNRDRHSLIVPLKRGDNEVCIYALDDAIGRDEFIKQCVFRISE